MRLIDADKLWKDITTQIEEYCDLADLIEIIETQATVDAVEVVRCKDCRYYDDECPYPVCNYHEDNVKETDFCSWGEGRENE